MSTDSSGRGVEGVICRAVKGVHKGRPYRRLRWVSAAGRRSTGRACIPPTTSAQSAA